MMNKEQRAAVRVRLAEIESANGGRLTPAAVVTDAKDKGSPLHSYFEWDTKKAAYAYWIEQARALITSVVVVQRVEKSTVSSVYYVRDPSAGDHEQGYVSLQTLRTDADLAKEAIVQEFSRAADMLRRAKQLAKALEVEPEVDALIGSVLSLRERVQESA